MKVLKKCALVLVAVLLLCILTACPVSSYSEVSTPTTWEVSMDSYSGTLRHNFSIASENSPSLEYKISSDDGQLRVLVEQGEQQQELSASGNTLDLSSFASGEITLVVEAQDVQAGHCSFTLR